MSLIRGSKFRNNGTKSPPIHNGRSFPVPDEVLFGNFRITFSTNETLITISPIYSDRLVSGRIVNGGPDRGSYSSNRKKKKSRFTFQLLNSSIELRSVVMTHERPID